MSAPPATAAGVLAGELWQAVAHGDEYAAVEIAHGALADGVGEETLLLDVIAAVQDRVGREWAAARLTVAQEHAATAVSDRVITALVQGRRRETGPGRAVRGRVTVCCAAGEWHALPARLVAEVLRLRGWRVDHLGAHTPTPHLVAHLHRTGSEAVLLSCSLATRLPAAHAAVTACQAVGVPVLAGGGAFGPDGRHAHALGADGWAPDARAAAAVLDKGVPPPDPAAARQVVDDLPHLADQEYTFVARSRSRLVGQTLTDLEDRLPALRSRSDAQRERTAEDLDHIVGFLATALYVDDPALFTTFLCWTADVLEARRVPSHSVVTALGVLGGRLRDFPRARRLLHDGAAALAGHALLPAPAP
ncbi:cobalamin B12-binding domain-containing protein [Streptomyces sp. NPDC006193]|uniref:cobalamin B12-binding domain-containing protein n=1 Tax=Streptomyces sp. NPDC006193 TaxID=3155717 RepID=UPI0033BF3AA8